jgi:hypothetical protein
MYRSDSSRDQVERDPRRDPRSPNQPEGEVVVDRKPIIADRSRDDSGWPVAPTERRTGERRRIERMGTDI